jgi:hypothetical protein
MFPAPIVSCIGIPGVVNRIRQISGYPTEYYTQSGNDHFLHFIMMEKSAQAGGEGCTPTPSHHIYHHIQSCSVRSS